MNLYELEKDNQDAPISYNYEDAEHVFPGGIAQYGNENDTCTGTLNYYIDTRTKKNETDCNGNTMRKENK